MLVLGHKGMLGQMVCKYFALEGYQIRKVSSRFNEEQRHDFIQECLSYPNAVVVNCIGKIKQKTDDSNELLWANALLPLALNNHLPKGQILVHPSTDCVFDGKKRKPYTVEDKPDALDSYGWSKRLGEVAIWGRPNTILMRVSIIGPDENPNGKGLLNWFLTKPEGSELKGYTNHLWNGITTLEWCKKLEGILNTPSDDMPRFLQLGTKEFYSKLEMLHIFQKAFKTSFHIKSFQAENSVDRRLKPSVKSKRLESQIQELVTF